MADREFKGIWIPKEIWLDERLNPLEKVILFEVDSLDRGEDGCYASNEYIAKFCSCSTWKVSTAISKLIDLGYIRLESFDGRQRVLKSCLVFSTKQPLENPKSDLGKSKAINNSLINTRDYNLNTSYSCPEPSKVASTPPVYTLPLNDGTNHEITSEDYEKYRRLYPSVDVMAEFRKMDGWFDGHPTKRKTRQGIRRFINSWLSKEQDKGGTKHDSVSTTPPPPPPKPVPMPARAPKPPAQDEEPKNVRRQVTLKDDDNRLVGLLYEDGEIVVIRKEGRFTHADVGPFGMKRINISGYRSAKRWEDATCDPDTQLSDFFP